MKILKNILVVAAVLLLSVKTGTAEDNDNVDELNSLLKGEISAVETYNQAMERFKAGPYEKFLTEARDDHQKTVLELSKAVAEAGGTPADSSGAWGEWAKAVTAAGKVFGPESALTALKAGEEHGLDEYQEFVEDDDVTAKFKESVTAKYIPAQRAHIQALDKLIAAVPEK